MAKNNEIEFKEIFGYCKITLFRKLLNEHLY